ncbi:hypothetical protein EDEG_01495 [Edhazardia aedis USNM 41457]|uniref:C3H1-type domain-containing protein n=1 Tax=Edhazardia aedis (strain USNM 41457) TaxID=1003232 RepID=J9D9N3_EDHAE|nr:hypothetical protein EDEG_01495 [Edhazardia aedis USNM 41457]|eukprot:EJW04214.1 hypothetical protein EDEG_01495 [Edhazardia aedis USNM 41457]
MVFYSKVKCDTEDKENKKQKQSNKSKNNNQIKGVSVIDNNSSSPSNNAIVSAIKEIKDEDYTAINSVILKSTNKYKLNNDNKRRKLNNKKDQVDDIEIDFIQHIEKNNIQCMEQNNIGDIEKIIEKDAFKGSEEDEDQDIIKGISKGTIEAIDQDTIKDIEQDIIKNDDIHIYHSLNSSDTELINNLVDDILSSSIHNNNNGNKNSFMECSNNDINLINYLDTNNTNNSILRDVDNNITNIISNNLDNIDNTNNINCTGILDNLDYNNTTKYFKQPEQNDINIVNIDSTHNTNNINNNNAKPFIKTSELTNKNKSKYTSVFNDFYGDLYDPTTLSKSDNTKTNKTSTISQLYSESKHNTEIIPSFLKEQPALPVNRKQANYIPIKIDSENSLSILNKIKSPSNFDSYVDNCSSSNTAYSKNSFISPSIFESNILSFKMGLKDKNIEDDDKRPSLTHPINTLSSKLYHFDLNRSITNDQTPSKHTSEVQENHFSTNEIHKILINDVSKFKNNTGVNTNDFSPSLNDFKANQNTITIKSYNSFPSIFSSANTEYKSSLDKIITNSKKSNISTSKKIETSKVIANISTDQEPNIFANIDSKDLKKRKSSPPPTNTNNKNGKLSILINNKSMPIVKKPSNKTAHNNFSKDSNTQQIDPYAKSYRTQLCKFFLNKTCTKGDECTYSHNLAQFPCKAYFVKKNCTRPNCQFSHDESVNPALIEQFKEEEDEKTPHKYVFISPLQLEADKKKR